MCGGRAVRVTSHMQGEAMFELPSVAGMASAEDMLKVLRKAGPHARSLYAVSAGWSLHTVGAVHAS